jgi:hypothetical protein
VAIYEHGKSHKTLTDTEFDSLGIRDHVRWIQFGNAIAEFRKQLSALEPEVIAATARNNEVVAMRGAIAEIDMFHRRFEKVIDEKFSAKPDSEGKGLRQRKRSWYSLLSRN